MAPVALSELPALRNTGHLGQGTSPQPIRVLHVINGEHYAGAERVQDLLASELGRFGFEVGFACIKPDRFPKMRRSRQAPLYEVRTRHDFDLRPVWELVRIVRRDGYRLLHAHTARSALIAGLVSKLTGVLLVHHVHSPTSRDPIHRWSARINALIERLSLCRAAALIAVFGEPRGARSPAGVRREVDFGCCQRRTLPPAGPATKTRKNRVGLGYCGLVPPS